MLLDENNIKCELSYAYLHAVAARVGCECQIAGRHSDGMGVDARVHVRHQFQADSVSRFTVDVQLKSTSAEMAYDGDRIVYRLGRKNYDELRDTRVPHAQILVVFFLPGNAAEWLACDEGALVAKKCAYWLSLHGAPQIEAATRRVFIPRANILSEVGLRVLLARFSREERIPYAT